MKELQIRHGRGNGKVLVVMMAVLMVLFSFMLPPLEMADLAAATGQNEPAEVIWYDDDEEEGEVVSDDEVEWFDDAYEPEDDVEWEEEVYVEWLDDDTGGVTDEVDFVVWEVEDSDGDEWEVIWENVEADEGDWEVIWEEVHDDPDWEIVWVELR